MCEFISWIDHKGEILFLDDDKLASRRGQELQAYETDPAEWLGHGSLSWFYGLKSSDGQHYECVDFSRPENFPAVIVEAIKACKFSTLGVPEIPIRLLLPSKAAKCNRIYAAVWGEFSAALNVAWAEHVAAFRDPEMVEYKKALDAAVVEYSKALDAAAVERERILRESFWQPFKDPANRLEIWR